MAKVEIYTFAHCPHCEATRQLLKQKGVSYKENVLEPGDAGARDEMVARGSDGSRTVPQIYINGQHIPGGNSNLQLLEREGKLDELLKGDDGNGPGGMRPA